MRNRLLLTALAALALSVLAGPTCSATASSAPDTQVSIAPAANGSLSSQEALAIQTFDTQLRAAAALGDRDAYASLQALADMDLFKRDQLAQILLGRAELNLAIPPAGSAIRRNAGSAIYTEGDSQWVITRSSSVTVAGAPRLSVLSRNKTPFAATIWEHKSSYDSTYKFAGVSIVTTRVWAEYKSQGSSVTSVQDWGCQIVRDFDVTADVSTKTYSKVASGGKVTFKCDVVVKRGAPTPLGQITWSTREAYQYMTVGSSGITAKGWS